VLLFLLFFQGCLPFLFWTTSKGEEASRVDLHDRYSWLHRLGFEGCSPSGWVGGTDAGGGGGVRAIRGHLEGLRVPRQSLTGKKSSDQGAPMRDIINTHYGLVTSHIHDHHVIILSPPPRRMSAGWLALQGRRLCVVVRLCFIDRPPAAVKTLLTPSRS